MSLGIGIGLDFTNAPARGGESNLLVFDTFARADDFTGMGNTESGQPWIEAIGGWWIFQHSAYCHTLPGPSVAVVDSGRANVQVRATTQVNAAKSMLVCRYVDANNFWFMQASGSLSLLYIVSVIAGAYAPRVSVPYSPIVGDTLSIKCKDSTIIAFINDVEFCRVSDPAHETATKHGVGNTDGAVQYNDFQIRSLSTLPPAPIPGFDELITSVQYADQAALLASHWGTDMDSYYVTAATNGDITFVPTIDGLTMTVDPSYAYHNEFITLQKPIVDYDGPFHTRLRGRMTRIPPVGDPDEGYDHEDPLLEIDIINPSIDFNGFYNETLRSAHFGVPLKFASVAYDPVGVPTNTYGDDVPELSGERADFVVIIEPGASDTRIRHFYGPVGGPLVVVLDVVVPFVITINLVRWSGIASKDTGHTTIERVSYYSGPVDDNPYGVTLT